MKTRRKNGGFTLIELVIVVTILVILTGMIVAKLDVVEMKAQKGVAAADMGDVFRFVQTFRVLTTEYPDGWDSLVDTTGALPVSNVNANIPGLHGELTGGPPFGPVSQPGTANSTGDPSELIPGTLAPGEIISLGREGITTLYDFPVNGGAANAWFDIAGNMPGNLANGSADATHSLTRVLTTATVFNCARLNAGSAIKSLIASGTGGQALVTAEPSPTAKSDSVIAAIYKGAGGFVNLPANKNLVAFGFGQYNEAVGSTSQNSLMPEAPFYPNENQNLLYNRFICIFETDTTGVRARLVAVLGADGDRMYDEIGDFYAQNP